jgi:hypothetical protein
MLIFDLHLTQLNCAIANWATIIRTVYYMVPNTNVNAICDWATTNLNPCKMAIATEFLISHI